ncbi:MAG: HIRAN domain-containing protein [Synergistaceae bacterium]|jgi:hypothetical protein|nr:HIRAN domain-containing protein [Synergistaceae bacterium]
MANIVRVEKHNIVQFLHSAGAAGLPGPFRQDIHLTDVHVAGVARTEGTGEAGPRLAVGAKLQFFREADNLHDPLAILVKDAEGNSLGYVPRNKNEVLSRLMDAGKRLYGTIVEKELVGGWPKIMMRIYLED